MAQSRSHRQVRIGTAPALLVSSFFTAPLPVCHLSPNSRGPRTRAAPELARPAKTRRFDTGPLAGLRRHESRVIAFAIEKDLQTPGFFPRV